MGAFPFDRRERRVIRACRTPRAVQEWLHDLPYNQEKEGETLRTFRGVMRHGEAHCLEAALAAATILEQHGWRPRLLSFQSVDLLDHVIFPFQGRDGRWGSVARSRDPGLHGRKPVFRSARALAASYMDTYVDLTGRLKGYVVVDLAELDGYDWRLSERNVWRVERWLLETPHRRLTMSDARYRKLRAAYRAFLAENPGQKPVDYPNRHTWM